MSETRICKYCSIEFPLDKFPSAGIKNGIPYRRRKCQICYQKTKRIRTKKCANWLESYKKTLSCLKCGNSDFRVLEFHHIDEKQFNIGDATNKGFSKKKIISEIEKCEVLCANCHRIETYNSRKNIHSISSLSPSES